MCIKLVCNLTLKCLFKTLFLAQSVMYLLVIHTSHSQADQGFLLALLNTLQNSLSGISVSLGSAY